MKNITFGKLLEKLLHLSNQKKSSLAKALGYDVSYISKWITGKNLPTQKSISDICKITSEFIVDSLNMSHMQELKNYFEIDKDLESNSVLAQYLERSLKEAYMYTKNFKSLEKERCNSIMFMGQVGAGKSHLSLAIANELMEDGVGVVYMSYREVITRLKQNIMDEVYYHRVMGKYKNARVLLIDDLFKGKVTESDVNIMFELLNFRYFNKLPLIVSCEMDVGMILNVDEAIGSRLVEMCKCVEVKGKKLNYRMYGK